MSNSTLKQLLNDYERKRNLAISVAEKKKRIFTIRILDCKK